MKTEAYLIWRRSFIIFKTCGDYEENMSESSKNIEDFDYSFPNTCVSRKNTNYCFWTFHLRKFYRILACIMRTISLLLPTANSISSLAEWYYWNSLPADIINAVSGMHYDFEDYIPTWIKLRAMNWMWRAFERFGVVRWCWVVHTTIYQLCYI